MFLDVLHLPIESTIGQIIIQSHLVIGSVAYSNIKGLKEGHK